MDPRDEDDILCRRSILGTTTQFKYERLPRVKLSALNETGRAESTIPVLKQRSYTGRKPVITSALADTRCIDLGMDRILEILNTKLGTSYTLNDSILQSVFQSFIAQNHDFGILYANVRPYWYDLTLIERIGELWMNDQERRQDCLTNNGISLGFPCRRVWDLCANRVVPCWVTHCGSPDPISHSWVAKEDRFDLWTPINCYEWPVPIPKDANLNLIRIEMLNQQELVPGHSEEYVWLDVLCLRQEGGEREDLRTEEWKVDVPTIGSLYCNIWVPHVVYYLTGLGRPLSLKPGDLDNERNWFNRAWTLQETAKHPVIGGSTDVGLITDNDVKAKLKEKLQSVKGIREADVFYFLWQMQIRKSTKPLDKVAGLAYLLCGDRLRFGYIPVYDETQSQEDAWDVLVDAMESSHKLELLFIYPEPGNGPQRWRPSWKQVMERRILCPDGSHPFPTRNRIRKLETGDFLYEGPCIESGFISGLAHGSYEEGKPRQGELVTQDGTGAPHLFNVFAYHAFPIPDGWYTLIGKGIFLVRQESPAYIDCWECWVVGWRRWDQRFEKLSVINTVDSHEKLWPDYTKIGDIEHFAHVLLC
ncbi:uncharacterized protein ARMOST_14061 [Armillaria ostoyae]|uniref:Heterokaryon incompatibility domain-containing protein n=1 Tax=Armillaria ostoyae TaxID=47428 RepID=A0A284RPJ2_ARMOS|nr:uncharacterized protein ARMOST_14061 [Armillaria ostoyae]